jgi:predicted small lipoprotein YifL
MKQVLIIMALSLLVAGCGVKNDLVKPNGQSTRDEADPSKPPFPLGR